MVGRDGRVGYKGRMSVTGWVKRLKIACSSALI